MNPLFKKIIFSYLYLFLFVSNCPFMGGWSTSLKAQEIDQEQLLQQMSQNQQVSQELPARWKQIFGSQAYKNNLVKNAIETQEENIKKQETIIKKTNKSEQTQLKQDLNKDKKELEDLKSNLNTQKQKALFLEFDSTEQNDQENVIDFLTPYSIRAMCLYENPNCEKNIFELIDRTKSSLASAHLKNQLSSKPADVNTLKNNQNIIKKLTSDKNTFDKLDNALDNFADAEKIYLDKFYSEQNSEFLKDFSAIDQAQKEYSLAPGSLVKNALIKALTFALALALKNHEKIENPLLKSKILQLLKTGISKIPGVKFLYNKMPGAVFIRKTLGWLARKAFALPGQTAILGITLLLSVVISSPVSQFIGLSLGSLTQIPYMGMGASMAIPFITRHVSNILLSLGFETGKNLINFTTQAPMIAPAIYAGIEMASNIKSDEKSSKIARLITSPWLLHPGKVLASTCLMGSVGILPAIGIGTGIGATCFLGKKVWNWWKRPGQIIPHIENMQTILNSIEEINNLIKDQKEFAEISSKISSLLNTESNTSKNRVLADLIKTIRTPKENYSKNRTLIENIFESIKILTTEYNYLLVNAMRAAAKTDYFMSLARLCKEHENTNQRFCFPSYYDKNSSAYMNFTNLWNPLTKENSKKYSPAYSSANLYNESNSDNTEKIQAIAIACVLANLGIAPCSSLSLTPFSYIENSTILKQDLSDNIEMERSLLTDIIDKLSNAKQKGEHVFLITNQIFHKNDPVCSALFEQLKNMITHNTKFIGMTA